MREQCRLLKQISQVTALWRDENVRGGIVERLSVQLDASRRRFQQSGNAIKEGRLAGPRGSEENRDSGLNAKIDCQLEHAAAWAGSAVAKPGIQLTATRIESAHRPGHGDHTRRFIA